MKDGMQQLPDSSRNALLHIARRLRGGFTGKVEIVCNQGGVQSLREIVTISESTLRDESSVLRAG